MDRSAVVWRWRRELLRVITSIYTPSRRRSEIGLHVGSVAPHIPMHIYAATSASTAAASCFGRQSQHYDGECGNYQCFHDKYSSILSYQIISRRSRAKSPTRRGGLGTCATRCGPVTETAAATSSRYRRSPSGQPNRLSPAANVLHGRRVLNDVGTELIGFLRCGDRKTRAL